MKKQYEFAGVGLEVSIPDQWMYKNERVLEPFGTSGLSHPHKFNMEVVADLTHPTGELQAKMPGYRVYGDGETQERYIGSVEQGWQDAYIRVVHCGRDHHVQIRARECGERIGVKTVLNSLAAEHLVLEVNGVILHASFIEHDGKAILFTAPSETGKSTQADLWAQYRDAEIINGDRAVIRLMDGKAYACGIPFAGSSKYCKNAQLPLAAIVYLGQAETTTIRRLGFKQAFRSVWEGCTVNTWNPDDLNKAIDIVQQITAQTPVFYLECTPDESAVLALEGALGSATDSAPANDARAATDSAPVDRALAAHSAAAAGGTAAPRNSNEI